VLPNMALEDIVHLTTGTTSALYKSLDQVDKNNVVEQVTEAIKNTFIYSVSLSALGFVLAFLLSVSCCLVSFHFLRGHCF
jgi:hypothetical protein